MDEQQIKSISKFLSLVLRHKPGVIGINPDENGWADVNDLLAKSAQHGYPFSKKLLEKVVALNDKKRFVFNDDHSKIRASQGHSISIDLNLQPQTAPEFLFHGTIGEFLPSIKKDGLQKMSRQYVHLSLDEATAKAVAGRRGKPVVLIVKAREMQDAGNIFYLSENGVWLTSQVPVKFIVFK